MIEYLAIGHLTVDRLASGIAPGGSVSYASVTAVRLGLNAGILTSAAGDIDWPAVLPGIEITRTQSPSSTSFENGYEGGRRTQRVLSIADPLTPDALPADWRRAPVVHLAPVTREVSASFAGLFPSSLVAITPQGLLRYWDADGIVRHGPWAGDDELLRACQVAVFSEEDLAGDAGFLERCIGLVPLVALTGGSNGATLFWGGKEERVPAFQTREVDPTGAGDVFAAAFLIEYNLTRDPLHSAAFACCAASYAVEAPGLTGIPNREAVEKRLELYRRMGE